MYDKLNKMGVDAACLYVYENYSRLKGDPGVQRWISEHAAEYATVVKTKTYELNGRKP